MSDVARIYSGYQARGALKHNPTGSYFLLQGKDLHESQVIDLQQLLRLEPIGLPAKYQVFSGDVLFQARGYANKAFHIGDIPDRTLAAATFYILRANTDAILAGYLAWYINQRQAQAYFKTHANMSTTVSYVSKEILMDLEIDIPDERTQSKIQSIQQAWQREKILLNTYLEKKEILIQETCLNAAQNKEKPS